jgi:hypothetical protein
MRMSLLTAPWFWVGMSIAIAAIGLAWLSSHPKPGPITSSPLGARPETKHDHGEFVDDLR